MARFDADALFQPIVVKLDGEEFTIQSVTTEMLEQVSALSEGMDPSKPKSDDAKIPVRQLAVILGVDESRLRNVHIGKIKAVLEFIRGEISGTPASSEAKKP